MQLGFPNAPTDNLYKFMAIFGAFGFLTLFLYADHMKSEAQYAVLKFSKNSTARFYQLVEGYAKNKPELDMKLLQEKFDDIAHTEGLEMVIPSEQYEFYTAMRNYISPLFFMLSFCGFTLWYIRVQKYQDQILRNEARTHNNQINAD